MSLISFLFSPFQSPANITDVSTANPLPVTVSSPDATLIITPTVSPTPAYSTLDCIGGKQTLANAVAVSGGSSFLHDVVITDKDNQKPTGYILYFNSDPAAATLTDNAALALSTDLTKVAMCVPVTSGDWITVDMKGICFLPNLGRKIKAATGTTLYATFLNVTTTPTFASTSALQFSHKFVPINAA